MAIPGTTTPHVGRNRICQGQQTGMTHISSGAGVTGGEVTHSVEEVLPTPIKINKLKLILQGYDVENLIFFISGFRHGFYLGYQDPRQSCFVKNSDSTKGNWEVVNTKLKQEMKMGRIAGPFNMPPFEKFRVSPLAVIPKSTQGEYRLIHNLSAPLGNSVNSFIPPELTSVKYQKLEDAINIIKQLGKGTLMSKLDIKDAFRLIPINPKDYELLGIHWDSKFYFDKTLPMGCSTSCAIFEAFSSAIHWSLPQKIKDGHIFHIIDDFHMLGETGSNDCKNALQSLVDLCSKLGVPIQEEKTVHPTTCIVFMGITLYSELMEARLPHEKIIKNFGKNK